MVSCPAHTLPDSLERLYLPNGEISFNDDTVFALTEHGEDLLYKVQKERRQGLLTVIAAVAGIIAAVCSIISVIRC